MPIPCLGDGDGLLFHCLKCRGGAKGPRLLGNVLPLFDRSHMQNSDFFLGEERERLGRVGRVHTPLFESGRKYAGVVLGEGNSIEQQQ